MLGANDGIVSTAGVVVGVAAATPNNVLAIATAGIAAHAEVELGIDHEEFTSPWAAAVSSFIAFAVGALIPLIMILLPVGGHRVWIAAIAVVIGLFLTGWISAALGGAPRGRAILRNVVMGTATMIATCAIGALFGVAIG